MAVIPSTLRLKSNEMNAARPVPAPRKSWATGLREGTCRRACRVTNRAQNRSKGRPRTLATWFDRLTTRITVRPRCTRTARPRRGRRWRDSSRLRHVSAPGPSSGQPRSVALRVPALRRQAGLGLPVRRADAGPADRHPPRLSQGRRARALRLPGARRASAIQAAMLAFRLETWEEAKVIFIFHVVGTAMEIFKTSVGSWIYPEAILLRIGGVPLFTGFMYAAHRLLHRRAAGGCSISASRATRRSGRSRCWRSASTSISSPTTTCRTCAGCCSR